MKKIFTYINSSFDEVINRVSWAPYAELQNNSFLVVIASLIFAALIFGIDTAFDKLLGLIY